MTAQTRRSHHRPAQDLGTLQPPLTIQPRNTEPPGSAAPSGSPEPQLGERRPTELGLGAPKTGNPASGRFKGWYSRGYLPHLDLPGILQSITFRLADALPQDKLCELERELASIPKGERDATRQRRIEGWLGAGMGCCALQHPQVAAVMQETLVRFDGARYRLLAWCIMPNHVHVLIEPLDRLAKIVQSWKSFTGRWALARNEELGLAIPGDRFWMREYWDRYVRDQRHLDAVIAYIHRNPLAAGLCGRAEEWPWSSAGLCEGTVGG